MQDRYVGDIGDFAKYGLLRAIKEDKRLGVAWYLHPDSGPPGDGGHTEFLKRSAEWSDLDPQLFHALKKIVEGRRSVAAVQGWPGILDGTDFADERLCIAKIPVADRKRWRRAWFDRVTEKLSDCDLVFADPDNGLVCDEKFRPTRKRSTKSIPLYEATALAEGRPAIIYHHNTMRKGGHRKEIRDWMDKLPGCTLAWYWRRWSNRTFFIVNPDCRMKRQLEEFANRWGNCGKLIGE